MRVRINLETACDAAEFSTLVANVKGSALIRDGAGHCVNAKSVLGALYALEFEELWFESDEDLYSVLDKFIVV